MDDNKTLSLQVLTQQMLSSQMPLTDDPEAALFELGIKPARAAPSPPSGLKTFMTLMEFIEKGEN